MKLTVVIVCSRDPLLDKCLKSIPGETPVVVMANFPSEEVLRILGRHPRVRVVRRDERNLGLLRQLATRFVDTPAVLYLDSDCEVTEGTVAAVEVALDDTPAVSVPMRYRSASFVTSVVARCRTFTTPQGVLFIPSAFRLDAQAEIGGHLFDSALAWGEDTDPARRFAAAGLPTGESGGLVWHRALGFRADAASARRLGVGRRLRERVLKDPQRVFWRDLMGAGEWRLALACGRKAGLLAAVYHLLVWRPSYKFGYWRERARRG